MIDFYLVREYQFVIVNTLNPLILQGSFLKNHVKIHILKYRTTRREDDIDLHVYTH